MKKTIFILSFLLLSIIDFAQVKISDLPVYTGTASGLYAPVIYGGITRKFDLGLIKGDSTLFLSINQFRIDSVLNAAALLELQTLKLNASDTTYLHSQLILKADKDTLQNFVNNIKYGKDSTAFYSQLFAKTDTLRFKADSAEDRSYIVNLYNTKLDKTDTASLSNRINQNLSSISNNTTQLTAHTSLINSLIADTATLQQRLNLKVNYSDSTIYYATPSQLKSDSTTLQTNINNIANKLIFNKSGILKTINSGSTIAVDTLANSGGLQTADSVLVYRGGDSSLRKINQTTLPYWGINGNSNTTSNNFIGTTNSIALVFKANNIPSGLIDVTNANTAFGYNSFGNISGGVNNTAVGCGALKSHTSNNNNTAIGSNAMLQNVSGSSNVSIGALSLQNGTSSLSNTAVGYMTLFYNNSTDNTAVGCGALAINSGNDNTAIGYNTGGSGYFTSGSYNTFLGANVNVATTVSNQVLIGDGSGNQVLQGFGTTKHVLFGYTNCSSDAGYTVDVNGKTRVKSTLEIDSVTNSAGLQTADSILVYRTSDKSLRKVSQSLIGSGGSGTYIPTFSAYTNSLIDSAKLVNIHYAIYYQVGNMVHVSMTVAVNTNAGGECMFSVSYPIATSSIQKYCRGIIVAEPGYTGYGTVAGYTTTDALVSLVPRELAGGIAGATSYTYVLNFDYEL